ncbi:MAG: zinc-dependent metalloprotease [Acidimicrobiales bacterium]
MSTPGPGNPFEGMPLFGEVAKLFASQGPLNWDLARQVAPWVANDGAPEANVDPLWRMRVEELARVADLHVADASGLSTTVTGHPLTIRAVGRADWATLTLHAWKPLLETLARSLSTAKLADRPGADDDEPPDPTAALLGNLGQVVSPVLLGLQAGFMVGHLAREALGQYVFPVPRGASDELLVVAPNIDAFAGDWSLPVDDVRLWVCLNEIAHHAVIGLPHVRARLDALLSEYVSSFEVNPDAFEQRLGTIDPTDPMALQSAFSDPESLLGAFQTVGQQRVRAELAALTQAIEGYVDHVMDTIGGRLVGSYASLTEALRRRRASRGEGDRFVERLFGLELGQRQYERGNAFVRGVAERAGGSGLARLWASERELPTPAEIEAPGLWLARIDLDA